MRSHRVLTAMLALSLGGALLGPAQPASAGVLDVTCTPPSSATNTYNPALTLTPRDVTNTSNTVYGPCVSPSHPDINSGVRVATIFSPQRSCLDLLSSGSVNATITWNTGATSTIAGNRSTTIAGAVLQTVITGTVTSGLFAGDTVLQTTTGPATNVTLCTLGRGTVSSIYGSVVLVITSA